MSAPTLLGPEWTLSLNQGVTDGKFTGIAPLANGTLASAVTFKDAVQIFVHNADGTVKNSSILQVKQIEAEDTSITALKDGGFVVTWDEGVQNPTTLEWTIYVQGCIYNADGSVRRGPFRVNDVETKEDYNGTVSALADGGFAVTYINRSVEGNGTDLGVLVKTYDANGNALGAGVRVNDSDRGSDQEDPSVAGLTGGGLVVVYSDDAGLASDPRSITTIRGKVIVNGGQLAEFVVPQTGGQYHYDPHVTALADGRFVVTWSFQDYGNPQAGDDSSVYARIFNADGTSATNEFRVNTTTAWDQQHPAITALRDGGFAVAYSSDPNVLGDDGDILVQRFTAAGQKDGAEIRVNTTTRGHQTEPVIKELADGRVIVGWTDEPIADGADNSRFQLLDFGNTITLPNDPNTPNNPNNPTTPTGQPSTGSDVLTGTGAANTINGLAGNDVIWGLGGNDKLYGGSGNDRLIGGSGKDTLYGQSGKDKFVFDDRDTGSSKSKADYLADFSGRGGDRIDLRAIDANSKRGGDQNFSFIGTKAFSKAGEVRYEKAGGYTYVYLNTDSDKSAEGVLKIKGAMDLSKGWFVL